MFLVYLASTAVFSRLATCHPHAHTSSSTALYQRDDQLVDEAVYLVECNRYSGDQKELDGTSDWWVYVSDDIKFRSSDKRAEATVLSAPAMDHQQHDGFTYHMNWTDGTADYPLGTTFGNGEHGFSIWNLRHSSELLPADGSVNGSVFHLLPGWRSIDAWSWLDSNKMECYGEDYTLPEDILNEGECVARYTCYREDRWVLRTSLHVYNDVIQVSKCGDRAYIPGDPPSLPNPSDVFGNVKDAIEKNQGSIGYDIGDTGCKIHFDYKTTHAPNDKFANDHGLAQRMADRMEKVAGGPVGQTQQDGLGDCVDDFITQGLLCAPCNTMTYPKEGYISREVSELKST